MKGSDNWHRKFDGSNNSKQKLALKLYQELRAD